MKIKYLLFLTIILSALSWWALIPIWQTPDEQAHFAQVAFLYEMGRNPGRDIPLDTTEEIFTSEKLLGTARDKDGNNKFTFHPEYRIEYTNSFIGKYEASISALSTTKAKNTFVHNEASNYPPLYYIPATWIYRFFYQSNLFVRIFSVRLWSVILFIATIFVVYKIGKLIFKEELFAIVLSVMVGFQPMMVFSNIGVNSDSLGNFLFTLFLFLSVKLIISRIQIKPTVFLFVVFSLAIMAKVQFLTLVPILFSLFLFIGLRDIRGKKKLLVIGCLIIGIAVLLIRYYNSGFGPFVLSVDLLKRLNLQSLVKFSLEYTLPHTYKEVMPWYWGIYDWLGVTYPRIVHRLINYIVIICMIGFIFWLFKVIRHKLWRKRQIQAVIFLVIVSIFYYLTLSIFDWLQWYESSFQLGIQGRYLFPVIVAHMLFLEIGWNSFFPNKWQLKRVSLKILVILMIVLNFYGLYTISSTYYNISSLQIFIRQASQYKPWFIKGNFLIVLFISFIISSCLFLKSFLPEKTKIDEKSYILQ